jgi:hypothetical protein
MNPTRAIDLARIDGDKYQCSRAASEGWVARPHETFIEPDTDKCLLGVLPA